MSARPAGVKTLRVNGFSMAYLERGSGVPLILVHGALSDFRAFEHQMAPCGARYVSRFLSAIGVGFKGALCARVDPGVARVPISPTIPSGTTFDRHGSDQGMAR